MSRIRLGKVWAAAGAVMLLSGSPVLAGGDADAGKAAYAICATCHAADGAGNTAMNSPRISGLSESYLARQLRYYRDGVRGADPKDAFGMQMAPMAKTLADDAALANVSAYIATLQSDPAPASLKDADVADGKNRYAVCATCHGAKGEGNDALNAPALAGQHDWYVARQVMSFKNGLRGVHPKDVPGMQMKPMAMTLPDAAAVKNVAAYVATLK